MSDAGYARTARSAHIYSLLRPPGLPACLRHRISRVGIAFCELSLNRLMAQLAYLPSAQFQ